MKSVFALALIGFCAVEGKKLALKKEQVPQAVAALSEGGCPGQDRFDKIMCKSHMCTMCVMQWCTEKCQEVQGKFPGCRCDDWPEDRKSFSGGDFAGKGGFGDSGDFAQGK